MFRRDHAPETNGKGEYFPMTAPTKHYRAPSITFAAAAIVLTCAAYVGGRFLGDEHEHDAPAGNVPRMRLAQAGHLSVPASRVASVRAKTPEAEKRLRAAANTFSQVHELARNEYVDALPSEQAMSYGAIRAMLSALEDEQSYFVTAPERQLFDAESVGVFEGIGAVTAIRAAKTKAGFNELRLLVVAPLPDSPAALAGLQTGDRITHVDGFYILGDTPYLTPSKLVRPSPMPSPTNVSPGDEEPPIHSGIGLLVAQMRLRQGGKGSHQLIVQRHGVAKPLRIAVRFSQTVAPRLVVRREKSSGRAAVYFRVGAFTEKSVEELSSVLQNTPSGVCVVLDLRQNAGTGSLKVAERICARLTVSAEPFAIEIGSGGRRTPLPLPTAELAKEKRPLSVLTDRGTAGFAEALASRLADSGATVVAAERTWGDGRSQTLYPLPDGSAFTLTTGRLISPKGKGWDQVGIAPRVLLPSGLDEADTVARAVAVAGRWAGANVATSVPAREAIR